MMFVEVLIGDSGAVDATEDLDKGVAIGLRKIWWESTIAESGSKRSEAIWSAGSETRKSTVESSEKVVWALSLAGV